MRWLRTLSAMLVIWGSILTAAPARAQGETTISGCEAPIPSTGTPDVSVASPVPVPFDLELIDQLLMQQAGESTLANLALQRANSSDVRRIALRVAESHAGEIQLLRSWRSAWYPDAEPLSIGPSATAQAAIQELCNSADFDRAFLESMIAQHQQAIELASAASSQIEHDALKCFVATYIEDLVSAIASMQTLLERSARS